MPQTRTRIVGSGFTTFRYNGTTLAFLDEIHDSGQKPIRAYEAITPLDAPYPLEFATPRVRQEGTIQLVMRELWNYPVWWGLSGMAGTSNIIDVYNKMAESSNPISCTTIIAIGATPPNQLTVGSTSANEMAEAGNTGVVYTGANNTAGVSTQGANNGNQHYYRGWTYHNCIISDIDDREVVQIGTLTFPRNLTLVYAYKTYLSSGGSNSGTAIPNSLSANLF